MNQEIEYVEVPSKWEIPYRYDIGEAASIFFTELLERGRIVATKCPDCGRVYMPPRGYCERCFVSLKGQWIELATEGTLEAFTIVTENYVFRGMPRTPFVLALVKLGGASTAIPQILEGMDLSDPRKAAQKLKVGMAVKVVFKEQREGRIEDFHVELVK